MIQIFKGDQSSVIFFDSGFADRRAFQVSSKIFDRESKVVRLFAEMDNPGFIVKLRSPRTECLVRADMFQMTRQLDSFCFEFFSEEFEKCISPRRCIFL